MGGASLSALPSMAASMPKGKADACIFLWLGGGAAKAMTDTAAFLKEQGRVQDVKANYGDFVTTKYVKAAMGK